VRDKGEGFATSLMTVEYEHIQAAQLALGRVVLSGRDLSAWRTQQGITDEDLDRAVAESAADTLDEIEDMLDHEMPVGPEQLREFLLRDGLTWFQIGWICRSRAEREAEPAPTA
jgi:hypothetical protein